MNTDPPRRGDQVTPEPDPVNRFTDAELAAEYWRSWNLFKTGNDGANRDWVEFDRGQVFHRFATCPHVDEVVL